MLLSAIGCSLSVVTGFLRLEMVSRRCVISSLSFALLIAACFAVASFSHSEAEGSCPSESSPGCLSDVTTIKKEAADATIQKMASSLQELSVAQIKDELRTKYDIDDTSDCLYKEEIVKRLQLSREAQAEVDYGGFQYGDVLRIGNRRNPTGIVTIAHGLGDSARGWEDVAQELSGRYDHLLFLLPTSPKMPVTINNGALMNAWFDVKGLGNPNAPQDPNILKTSHYVTTLARQAANRYRIPTSRILFGGFSQGGALSLASGLTAPYRAAGILVMSGFFAASEYVIPKVVNRDLPVFIAHGTQDPVLPLALSEMTRGKLQQLGLKDIEYRTYPMAHTMSPQELEDVSAFIGKVLPRTV